MNIQGIGQSMMYGSQVASGVAMPAPPREAQTFEPTMDAAEIMEQDDASEDGVLTIEETPLSEQMFSDADTNSDGEVSLEELEEFLASGPVAMGTVRQDAVLPDADTIMETDDANADGILTIDETPLTEDMFADADTDGDGELSVEELDAYLSKAESGDKGPQSLAVHQAINAYETASMDFMNVFDQKSETDHNIFSGVVI